VFLPSITKYMLRNHNLLGQWQPSIHNTSTQLPKFSMSQTLSSLNMAEVVLTGHSIALSNDQGSPEPAFGWLLASWRPDAGLNFERVRLLLIKYVCARLILLPPLKQDIQKKRASQCYNLCSCFTIVVGAGVLQLPPSISRDT
jgi:hypothetical protein